MSQGTLSIVRMEQNPNSSKQFAPTKSSMDFSSLGSMTSNEEGSSLKYHSMEEGYKRRDGRNFDRNDHTYDHWHRGEDCFKRQVSAPQLGSNAASRQGSAAAVNGDSLMVSNESCGKNESGLLTYSSGYNSSSSNRESVWIEMSDAYGNELRRRKTSDTKMGSIKIELMEIAENWKRLTSRSHFRIIAVTKNFDLSRASLQDLDYPVATGCYFMVQYY